MQAFELLDKQDGFQIVRFKVGVVVLSDNVLATHANVWTITWIVRTSTTTKF